MFPFEKNYDKIIYCRMQKYLNKRRISNLKKLKNNFSHNAYMYKKKKKDLISFYNYLLKIRKIIYSFTGNPLLITKNEQKLFCSFLS